MNIAERIIKLKEDIPEHVKLVAVSKTKPDKTILEAYNAGQRIFGENKVQDLVAKYEILPKEIQWHFIGHLQSNKVKYIAPFIKLLHGVDSIKLLQVINKEAKKNNRVIDCLMQMHIASEDTKFGLSINELHTILEDSRINGFNNIRIVGLMGMATYTDDESQIRMEFSTLKKYFDAVKEKHFSEDLFFSEISMGMSGDYQLAIEEGSTMIRVGSSIFGPRNY